MSPVHQKDPASASPPAPAPGRRVGSLEKASYMKMPSMQSNAKPQAHAMAWNAHKNTSSSSLTKLNYI